MDDALPRRLAVAWTVLVAHAGILLVAAIPGDTGTAVRIFLDQMAWAAGLFLTNGSRGEAIAYVLHAIALVATFYALRAWHRGEADLRRALWVAAGANAMLAPIGVAPALLLGWIARQDALEDALRTTPLVTGHARIKLIAGWLAATLLLIAAAILAFLSFPTPIWFLLIVAAPMAPCAVLWWMMRSQGPLPTVVQALPPLPDMQEP